MLIWSLCRPRDEREKNRKFSHITDQTLAFCDAKFKMSNKPDKTEYDAVYIMFYQSIDDSLMA